MNAMTVTSTAFSHQKPIPARFTCDGDDISPPLAWKGVPDTAKSLVLICDDPDAPVGTWVHWVVYNLPPATDSLPEHIMKTDTLANGAKQGITDFKRVGYGGPCPPSGTHRYFFKLYALDTMIALPAGKSKKEIERAMQGHVLAYWRACRYLFPKTVRPAGCCGIIIAVNNLSCVVPAHFALLTSPSLIYYFKITIAPGEIMVFEDNPEGRTFDDARACAAWLAPLRAAGKTLVTTNGCFDILHSGHVRYLAEAAKKGDLLVVGVNADATVQRLKGDDRPLRSEADRVCTVAALAMVDAAFIFREDDPREFIETLKPDLHVKGGDYTRDIIERESVERNGGKVAIVSYVTGFSTTSIIKKMQRRNRR